MPNARVIDLSHWNTIPSSLKPAKQAGVWGVIHKATEGSSVLDKKYEARKHLAKEAGMLFGAYHFLRPGSIKSQAEHFIKTVQPTKEMLLAADHEDRGVSLNDLQLWLEIVETATGIRPVIYSGHVLKEQLGGKAHATLNGSNYKLWLAQYNSKPVLPSGWNSYWLWQWTDKGQIDGIDPPTDCNDYQGTLEQLVAEWQGSTPAPVGNDIGWAVKHMQNGGLVARTGWNGKNMHLALQRPDGNSKMTLPYVYIFTVQGDRVPWLCSQTDLLAADWIAV